MKKINYEELYLDWLNNFLTVDAFADYYQFSINKANRVIRMGRKLQVKNSTK